MVVVVVIGSDDQTNKAIDGRTSLCAFDEISTQLFGGCKELLEVKTKTCDANIPQLTRKSQKPSTRGQPKQTAYTSLAPQARR